MDAPRAGLTTQLQKELLSLGNISRHLPKLVCLLHGSHKVLLREEQPVWFLPGCVLWRRCEWLAWPPPKDNICWREHSGTLWRREEAMGCLRMPLCFVPCLKLKNNKKQPNKQTKKRPGKVERCFLCWRWAETALSSRGRWFVVACCPLRSIQAEAFLARRREDWAEPVSLPCGLCNLAAQAFVAMCVEGR